METVKLTQDEKELLLSPHYKESVTVNQHDELHDKINSRFSYCMTTLFKKFNINYNWFDYDNEAGEDSPGEFDIVRYQEEIGFTGEFPSCKTPGWQTFQNAIPTEWLWTDFESDLDQFIADAKTSHEKETEKQKTKRILNKQKKDTLIASIKSKLTKQELAIIKFK